LIGRYDENQTKIPRFRPLPQSGDFVQILNLQNRQHWICIGGNCEEKSTIRVDVYDSLNSDIMDHELISLTSSLFRCHENLENFEFAFYNVTDQLDGSSCGVSKDLLFS
jgi:hypothetical protein